MAASSSPRTGKSSNVRRTSAKQRGRSHVLDVSVRTSQAGRLRKRKVYRFTLRLFLVFVVAAGLYFGIRKVVSTLLLENPDYNVAEMNVETDGMLARETVLEAADLHKGANIFFINLDRTKARIEAIPQVEKVQVSKQLPNRISIQITERKPVAWVAPEHGAASRDEIASSPGAHLVDARGVLLPSKNAQSQDRYLPIIRNYTGGPRTDGQEVEGEEIKAALDLLHAQQDSVIAARFQIQEIDLSKHFGLQVTDRNGLQVLFGLDEMERQLKRLDVDLQMLDQSSQKPQTINLLVQKNVPVTFVAEPVASAPVLSTPAPSASATPSTPVKPAAVSGKAKVVASGKETETHHTGSKSTGDQHRHKAKHGLQPFGITP